MVVLILISQDRTACWLAFAPRQEVDLVRAQPSGLAPANTAFWLVGTPASDRICLQDANVALHLLNLYTSRHVHLCEHDGEECHALLCLLLPI